MIYIMAEKNTAAESLKSSIEKVEDSVKKAAESTNADAISSLNESSKNFKTNATTVSKSFSSASSKF